jgi:hypothetical protein
MQLRHIRPGSLEWQDAQTDEAGQVSERLTPEEIEHLRKLSEDRSLRASEKKARTQVQ